MQADEFHRNKMLSMTPSRIIAAYRAEELSERFEAYLERPDLQALLLEGFRDALRGFDDMEGVPEVTLAEILDELPEFAYTKAKAAVAPISQAREGLQGLLLAFEISCPLTRAARCMSAWRRMSLWSRASRTRMRRCSRLAGGRP